MQRKNRYMQIFKRAYAKKKQTDIQKKIYAKKKQTGIQVIQKEWVKNLSQVLGIPAATIIVSSTITSESVTISALKEIVGSFVYSLFN